MFRARALECLGSEHLPPTNHDRSSIIDIQHDIHVFDDGSVHLNTGHTLDPYPFTDSELEHLEHARDFLNDQLGTRAAESDDGAGGNRDARIGILRDAFLDLLAERHASHYASARAWLARD